MNPRAHALFCILLSGGFPCFAASGWTQYRGSNHDGVSTEPIRLDWTANAPRTLWKVPLPNGLSSFSVDKTRLFTMGARNSQGVFTEFCIALDASTGRELWASPIGIADYPNLGVGPDDGTRGTPTVDGALVYAFGAYMNLVCFNASTGAEVWKRDLRKEFGSTVISWQNAASPLLVGDLVLVNGNGRNNEHLLAFRKSDGVLVWKTGTDGMTQSTPVRAIIGGVDQAIFFAQSGLVSVAPATGDVLWRYAIRYNSTSVAASPVVVGDTVYASRAYPTRAGALVVRVTKDGAAFSTTKVWEKQNQLMNHWATPVFYDGYYYGIYGQGSLNLRAVDALNGDTKWVVNDFGYGSVTRVRDKLLVLGDRGDLALIDTNPQVYTELARIRPLVGRCWNNPAISDGRIYIRSSTEAVALDVAVAQPASPLKLEISVSLSGELNLLVSSENGMPIDQAQASGIEVFFADTLGSDWSRFTAVETILDGKLLLSSLLPNASVQYFRARRNP